MPIKNEAAQAIRMAAAIRKCVGEQAAADFEQKFTLSRTANVKTKFKWAKDICNYLDEKYDEDTVREIRENCCCNSGNTAAKHMKTCLKKTDCIKDFVDLFNGSDGTNGDGWLEYISENSVFMCYSRCMCGCVRHVDDLLPETWCYCAIRYARDVFTQVFGEGVSVQLIESVKTGATRCTLRVEWQH